MALKIRTGAEDIPGGLEYIENCTHTKWKRIHLSINLFSETGAPLMGRPYSGQLNKREMVFCIMYDDDDKILVESLKSMNRMKETAI